MKSKKTLKEMIFEAPFFNSSYPFFTKPKKKLSIHPNIYIWERVYDIDKQKPFTYLEMLCQLFVKYFLQIQKKKINSVKYNSLFKIFAIRFNVST